MFNCMVWGCENTRDYGSAYCNSCSTQLSELGWDRDRQGDEIIVQNRDNYAENMKETTMEPKPKKAPKSSKTSKKGKKKNG